MFTVTEFSILVTGHVTTQYMSDLGAKDTSSWTRVFESLPQSFCHLSLDGAVLLPKSCRYWPPVCVVCAWDPRATEETHIPITTWNSLDLYTNNTQNKWNVFTILMQLVKQVGRNTIQSMKCCIAMLHSTTVCIPTVLINNLPVLSSIRF